MMMAPGGDSALLKAGVRVFIVGERTTAEYVAGIAARRDASRLARSSSLSVTSMCAKMSSRFCSTQTGGVSVLMIHWLLVALHT